MRSAAVLLLVLLLAGCSSPAADDPLPTTEPGDPRTGRGGPGGEDEPPHKDIQIDSRQIDVVGQGPSTYDVEVPPNVTHVSFLFVPDQMLAVESMKVALDACGTYDGTNYGHFGGGTEQGIICSGDAAPGSHAVTITGRILLLQGTMTLTGWQPLGNGAAPPKS